MSVGLAFCIGRGTLGNEETAALNSEGPSDNGHLLEPLVDF
jgi:hypothetical protein